MLITKVLIISLILFFKSKRFFSGYFSCSTDQIFNFCKNPYQPSCQLPTDLVYQVFHCDPGCFGKPGLVKDELFGTCILPSQCTSNIFIFFISIYQLHLGVLECPSKEAQNRGKTVCETICESQVIDFECWHQNKKCVCKDEFVRDIYSGKCIPAEYCTTRKFLKLNLILHNENTLGPVPSADPPAPTDLSPPTEPSPPTDAFHLQLHVCLQTVNVRSAQYGTKLQNNAYLKIQSQITLVRLSILFF